MAELMSWSHIQPGENERLKVSVSRLKKALNLFLLLLQAFLTKGVFSSSLSLKCALRQSGCRIGYEPTKMSRDHFRRSISRETNVEVLHCSH